jgi:hypothetical protein
MKIKPVYSLSLLATVSFSAYECIFAVSSSGPTLSSQPPSLPPHSPTKKSLLPNNSAVAGTVAGSDECVISFAENSTYVTGAALHSEENGADGMVMSTESKMNWLCGLDTAVVGEVSPLAAFNAWAEQVSTDLNFAIFDTSSKI